MVRCPTGGDPKVLIHPLSYVRWERDWSYQDVVDRIARRLSNSAARREKAWRWEHWRVVPDEDSQLALAAELGVSSDLVRLLGWPHWLPVGEQVDFDEPWNADGTLAVLQRTAGSAVLDRRGFLMLGTGVASALAAQWTEIEPPQLVSVLRGGRLDAGLVAAFEQRLPGLRQMEMALGGGSVRELVDTELRLVTDLLGRGSYSEKLGQRLFCVAAELGRVAGWASFDAGYHAAAERYWAAGLRSAHTGGDRAVGANILKCMSLQRVDADRSDEALILARAAREGAKGSPARVMAMLTVRQARTHAVRGESTECERLLVDAETAMERADDEPAPSWSRYFDLAEYCAQVAACYLLLRRHAATDYWLTQALNLQPEARSRDRATYLIWRAETMLGLGDIEHACALVSQVIPDIVATRSVRNQSRLADIHRTLMGYKHPAVTLLDEQVRSLVA